MFTQWAAARSSLRTQQDFVNFSLLVKVTFLRGVINHNLEFKLYYRNTILQVFVL